MLKQIELTEQANCPRAEIVAAGLRAREGRYVEQQRVDRSLGKERREGRPRWARLITKVYEADPLLCPRCGGPVRIIAFID